MESQESDTPESEQLDWIQLSLESLDSAYCDDEPEYTSDLIRESNPDYERT
jgi:hypothetical protein